MGTKQKKSILPFILNVAGLVVIAVFFQNCSIASSSKMESENTGYNQAK